MESTEFESLLAKLAARDDEAARQLVERLYARVEGVVRPRIGERFRAKMSSDSIANSAFRSFLSRHADSPYSLAGEEDLMRLLARIALGKCFNRIRSFRTRRQDAARESEAVDLDLVGRDPGPEFDVEVRDLLEAKTRGLSEVEREVIHLSVSGHSPAEIAAAVEVTERTVYRVLERFRRKLTEETTD